MGKCRTAGAAAFPVFLAVLLLAQPASATTVSFTPSPGDIGTTFKNTNVDLFSTGLNGMTLSGQPLSLDLSFTNELLARIQLLDAEDFDVVFTVFTNAGGEPGFAGMSTGFLLNPNAGQLGSQLEAGRSQGSDGTFDLGLVTFLPASFGANVVDISGVHFDTSFPNTGFLVTNTQLRFTLNNNELLFGTAQQLPEASTLGLLFAGISFGSLLYRRGAPGR